MPKKSLTAKAVQQKFFEERGITVVKSVPQRKDAAGAIFPDKIIRLTDDCELTHVSNGLYRYTKVNKNSDKQDCMVKLYSDFISRMISYGLWKSDIVQHKFETE